MPLLTIMYASVVSLETVRIALLMAALNDLEVKVGDVLNAYVTAPVTEKAGPFLALSLGLTLARMLLLSVRYMA